MKTIDFKIIYNKNNEVYQTGFVEVPDDIEEECEWFYYNQSGMTQPRMFTHHEGIGISQIGATFEQEDEVIVTSEEDENATYTRGDITIVINEGAKMECEIIPDIEPSNEYIVEIIPRFNNEKIDLAKYMLNTYEIFDPYNEYGYCEIKEDKIFFEVSKDYFDDDCRDEQLELINEEARRLYARALTYELRIGAKYGEVLEQALDDSYDNEWLFKMSQVTDETLEQFIEDEGFVIGFEK